MSFNKSEQELLIEDIHASDTYGVFVEIGAGQPLSAALFEVPGASQTVHLALSPYSKEAQSEYYHTNSIRAVSKEAIEKILILTADKYRMKHCNTIYVSSFQIGDDIINHGWIGLKYKDSIKYYHITLTKQKQSRKARIEFIGKIATMILSAQNDFQKLEKIFGSSMYNGFIDIIDSDDTLKEQLELCLSSVGKTEHPLLISKEGKLERLVDWLRKDKVVGIYKGSYNPIHLIHLQLMQEIKKEAIQVAFAISYETYQKGNVSMNDFMHRIKMLNHLGYPVIIFRTPWYNTNVAYLRETLMYEGKVLLPMGLDTWNRVIESSYDSFKSKEDIERAKKDFENCEFILMGRIGHTNKYPTGLNCKSFPEHHKEVSSTFIRELIATGNYTELANYVPKEIITLL